MKSEVHHCKIIIWEVYYGIADSHNILQEATLFEMNKKDVEGTHDYMQLELIPVFHSTIPFQTACLTPQSGDSGDSCGQTG